MDDIFIPPLYDGFFIPEVFGWIRVCKEGEWGYLDVNNEFTPDESKAYLCYRCQGTPFYYLDNMSLVPKGDVRNYLQYSDFKFRQLEVLYNMARMELYKFGR